jgi:hypothetical protein
MDDELLTEAEAARFLRISVRTLQRLSAASAAPPKLRLTTRRIAYRRADLVVWAAERRAPVHARPDGMSQVSVDNQRCSDASGATG